MDVQTLPMTSKLYAEIRASECITRCNPFMHNPFLISCPLSTLATCPALSRSIREPQRYWATTQNPFPVPGTWRSSEMSMKFMTVQSQKEPDNGEKLSIELSPQFWLACGSQSYSKTHDPSAGLGSLTAYNYFFKWGLDVWVYVHKRCLL